MDHRGHHRHPVSGLQLTCEGGSGRVAFACWREPKLNPWNMLPYQAIRALVPPLPKLGVEDPGPFSFADPARVRRILETAGFIDVALTPHAFAVDIAGGDGFDAAVEMALEIGPASLALHGQGEDVLRAARAALSAARAPCRQGERVGLDAAMWIIEAKAP